MSTAKLTCTFCKKKGVPHTILDCKMRQSIYCCVCAAYGHREADCPDKRAWAIRQGKPIPLTPNLELVVEDSEKGVKDVLKQYKDFLKEHGKNISSGMINRQLLRDVANCLSPPRCLLFCPSTK